MFVEARRNLSTFNTRAGIPNHDELDEEDSAFFTISTDARHVVSDLGECTLCRCWFDALLQNLTMSSLSYSP